MGYATFHRQLETVKEDLLKMASMVEKAISEATEALVRRDLTLAKAVIQRDRRVNALENQIESNCVRLLATQQPVAVDLRFITSAMKINTFLERMGDQAVNVAERALELSEMESFDVPPTLQKMAVIAQEMTRQCLDSFVRKDVTLAYQVCARDDELDNLNRHLLEEMIQWMMREHRLVLRGVELIIAGRHLERIGDEATNIAEEVVFLVEGMVIRHAGIGKEPSREDGPDPSNLTSR